MGSSKHSRTKIVYPLIAFSIFLSIWLTSVAFFEVCAGADTCGPDNHTPASGRLQALEAYTLEFSTYLGGSGYEHARDIFVDSQGYVYLTGGTASTNFPHNPGAYDRTFAQGGKQIGSAGYMDVFITKYDPNGNLVWSTYLGGPNYDRAYGIGVWTARATSTWPGELALASHHPGSISDRLPGHRCGYLWDAEYVRSQVEAGWPGLVWPAT
jgi:hypothetical protein